MLTPEEAERWLEFNRTYRFGTALFVDGKCRHGGYFTKEQCEQFEREFAWVARLRAETGT